MTITIQTRKGNLIQRKATVSNTIDNSGRITSWAQVGIHLYKIIERTSAGNIWRVI
jgi:hypothetical protein